MNFACFLLALRAKNGLHYPDMSMKGSFIVFEGPDGAGTTRHSQWLAERLRTQGMQVMLTTEPTDGPIGEIVRSLLQKEPLPSSEALQLLFCADRADHIKNVIEPALKAGQTVLCDRYTLSTMIYGEAAGVDREWLEEINRAFPTPDLTIITLPPFDVCMERLGRREENDAFETETFQRRVYELYASLEDPTVVFCDTSGPKEEVASDIFRKVEQYFGEISRDALTKMNRE